LGHASAQFRQIFTLSLHGRSSSYVPNPSKAFRMTGRALAGWHGGPAVLNFIRRVILDKGAREKRDSAVAVVNNYP
jgi:hypothetical protein